MSFTIQFDYRFDTANFFADPARRAALEAAADLWESIIADDFDDLPVGLEFDVTNPTTDATESITLTSAVDDIIVFVGARNLSGNTLGRAGPTGYSADGDIYGARISSDFRGTGPVTDFEPWAGTLVFDTNTNWSFDLAGPVAGKNDFLSIAGHEIGHILGIGTSGAFDAFINNGEFVGPNAMASNGGDPVPLHDDDSHVEDGFDDDMVSLDPSLTVGQRVLLSDTDKAILADIGYQVTGFTAQGSQPDIATNSGETIFGSILGDTIDGLAGNDQIQGDRGNDILRGGAGNDTLFGQEGADTLEGGANDDQIQGGSGNDNLRGGGGDDTLFGQGGVDIFTIGLGDGQNTIIDMDLSNEVIHLVDSGFANIAAVLAAISKPFSNVSRLTLSDGTTADIFHTSQSGTPLNASHFDLGEPAGNASPTGSVTINGTAIQGATLTANTSSLADADGLGAFSYTWLRDSTEITGATASQYTLGQPDVDAQISVRVSYTDGQGTGESVTSAKTGIVGNVNDAPTGGVSIGGTPTEGNTLTASTSSLADLDGLGALSFVWLRDGVDTGETGVTYQLQADDIGAQMSVRVSYVDQKGTAESVTSAATQAIANQNDLPAGTLLISGTPEEGATLTANASGISDADGLGAFTYTWLRDGSAFGATGETYVLTAADIGAAMSVRISYVDGQGTAETVTSSATAPVSNVNDAPTGGIGITGTAAQGQVLTADTDSLQDADGLGVPSFAWLRDGAVISGATAATYALTQDDVGAEISVRLSYTDGQGTFETVTSPATAPVANVNDAPTGTATLSGTPTQFETLTASGAGITDIDGLGAFSFAWQRDGVTISGATGQTYDLTQADVGARITALISYTDGGGTLETVATAQSAPVQNINDDPAGAVVLTGMAVEGKTLTADASSLSDVDGLGAFDFAWFRDGALIAAATDASYELVAADIGAVITAQISYVDGQGTAEAITSGATMAVLGADQLLEGDADDNLVQGGDGDDVLSGGAGEDTLEGGAGADRFVVSPGEDSIEITDFETGIDTLDLTGFSREDALAAFYAVGPDLMLTFNDGTSLQLAGAGLTQQTFTIADVAFATGNLAPTGSVTVTGTPVVGQSLTADFASVSDGDGINLSTAQVQWLRDGVPIAGALGTTYAIIAADAGAQLSATYQFDDNFGASEAVTSAATSPVTVPGLSLTGDGTANTLIGGAGDDVIMGLGANDTLTGGAGDDTIDGGAGIDTATYDGDQSSYTLTLTADGAALTDRRADGNGTDTLTGLEFLDFETEIAGINEAGLDLRKFGGPATLSQDEMESVIELYIAYFNRAPDAVGLFFWATAFANDTSLDQMATLFIDQPETTAAYPPGTSNEVFVETVYDNVLGRASDDSGFNFWVGVLENGSVQRDAFILEVLRGAKADPSQDATPAFIAQQQADRVYLATKIDIGAYFAVHKGMSDTDNASAAMALFDGTASGTQASVNAIDGFYADANDAQTGEFLMPLVGVLDDPFSIV